MAPQVTGTALTMLFKCKPILDGLEIDKGELPLYCGGYKLVLDWITSLLLEAAIKSAWDDSKLFNSATVAGDLEVVTSLVGSKEPALFSLVFNKASSNWRQRLRKPRWFSLAYILTFAIIILQKENPKRQVEPQGHAWFTFNELSLQLALFIN